MLFALETFGSIAVSSVMYLLSAWYGSNPGPADRVRAASPAMDIADAEARADALTDELAKVAAALRRSRRKRRQQHEDPKKFLKERLCGFLGRLVLTMFQMCGHVTRVPADFLHGHGRRKIRVHGSCTMQDTEEAVQGLYMQTTAAELADLMVVSQENQSSRFLHVHAARYVLEHRLFEWLLHQNCERGVAPSPRALLEQVPNMLPGCTLAKEIGGQVGTFGSSLTVDCGRHEQKGPSAKICVACHTGGHFEAVKKQARMLLRGPIFRPFSWPPNRPPLSYFSFRAHF